jgi:hypothetical protein
MLAARSRVDMDPHVVGTVAVAAVNMRPRLTLLSLGRTVAWFADWRRTPCRLTRWLQKNPAVVGIARQKSFAVDVVARAKWTLKWVDVLVISIIYT